MISKVYMICDAYEAGFGKGQVLSKDANPYDVTSDSWEAWNIGYLKASRIKQVIAGAKHHDDKGYEIGTQEEYEKFKIRREDPCCGCLPGHVCRTPHCGRLKLPLDHPLRTLSYWNKK